MTIEWWMHILCWILPLFVSLIPLTETTYGSDGKQWCFLQSHDIPHLRVHIWEWACFYFWVFASMFVIAGLIIKLKIRDNEDSTLVNKRTIQVILKKLQYYPVIIIFCWLPACIFDSLIVSANEDSTESTSFRIFDLISTAVSCSHGFLFSVIFWYQNQEVIEWWMSKNDVNVVSIDTMTSSAGALHLQQRKLFDAYNDDDLDSEREESRESGFRGHMDSTAQDSVVFAHQAFGGAGIHDEDISIQSFSTAPTIASQGSTKGGKSKGQTVFV
jgi:hypothetical protein